METNQNIDDRTWQDNSLLIKSFIEQRYNYEQLCQEVAYILEKAVEKGKVEYSSITYRAKTLKSFLEKIIRKIYHDPLNDITDFAGVRLVFLYNSDFDTIEKIVKANFKLIEKVDKLNDKGVDKFGYGAIHYIVQLSKKYSGARYDDLKNLLCEIQVRTVLQDSWSIIDHHLVYKNESDIPKQLRRKLNSLAGLFETADDQFNQIKNEREAYIESVHESKAKPKQFLETELNIDTFKEYLLYKFPLKPLETFVGQMSACYSIIRADEKIKTLKDIDIALEKVKPMFDKINKVIEQHESTHSSSAYVSIALAISNDKIINSPILGNRWKDIILKKLRLTST
jgi:putative GTP pyrophosphokinase